MKRIFYSSIAQGIYKPQTFRESFRSIDAGAEHLQLESRGYNGHVIDGYFFHKANVYLRLHFMEGDQSNNYGTTIMTAYGSEENISEIERIILDLDKSPKTLKSA